MTTTEKLTFDRHTFSEDEIDALLSGDNFRRLKPGHRDRIVNEMRLGRWCPDNGECLAFGPDGALLNGQHRLSAAQIFQRESGEKVWFWCARNVDPQARFTMDQSASRSLGDFLRHEGVEYANEHSAIVRSEALMILSKGKSLCPMVNGVVSKDDNKSGSKNTYHLAPSLLAQVDVFRRNRKALITWARISNRMSAIKFPRPGLLASLGYQFAKVNPKHATDFFESLISGADLSVRDPVRVLRERLLKEKTAKAKVSRVVIAGLVVKAWLLWNKGDQVDSLRYNASGPMAEDFPDHRDVA